MPLRNRVTPFGDIVAVAGRGTVMGNRGILHDAQRTIVRDSQVRRWIACRLEFSGRHRTVMTPGSWTELFFLDEATAFAAGHRPCAECRRADYDRFVAIQRTVHGAAAGADAIDARLHAERIVRGTRMQRHHESLFDDLPDGAFVLHDGAPHLVLGDRLLRWTPAGYADGTARPAHVRATAITPPSLLAVLRADWQPLVPLLHPS